MEQDLVERFHDLLLEYSQQNDPTERQRIEDALWAEFGAEQAVFVLDMSGFSLLSRKYGVVQYLSMVRRMQLTAVPIIESHDGRVVKFEADNCFALFSEPLSAIRAGIALNLAFEAANILTPSELDIRIACGIDFGRILMIGEGDCFGDAVNRASKLGEDLAGSGEILATKEAMARIPKEANIRSRMLELSISGITLEASAIEYRREEKV
ncbi:MAG: adenylate/guanylate cyclase domain-containing protein [Anaerolineae bacterium]|nr:adenylate/guanylate cyclase domain-containing protein [Anaerolineae bacterium]